MAFKLNGASGYETKQYLFQVSGESPIRTFVYVSADTPATIAANAYIDAGTNGGDHQIAYDMLRIGDKVLAYQCAAIDDTQTVNDDISDGLTDYSEHLVVAKNTTAKTINLSDDLVNFTVTGQS